MDSTEVYCIDNNIEIVTGKKNACIYNFNTSHLLWSDQSALRFLSKLIGKRFTYRDNSMIPQEIWDVWIHERIVIPDSGVSAKLSISSNVPSITFAWIEITPRCNCRCLHCYENSSPGNISSDMTWDSYVYVISELIRLGVRRVQLIGGEPLMHKDFKRFIEYIGDKFEYVEVFTNGTLLDLSMVEFLRERNIHLAFSLYSDVAKIHDNVTQTIGSHEKTISAIEAAISRKVSTRVASVQLNCAPKFKMDYIEAFHKTDFPRLTGRANAVLYSRDMIKSKIITKRSFAIPVNAEQFFNRKIYHNCFSQRIYIDSMLNVYPCVMERRFSHGRLKPKGLQEIINDNITNITKDNIYVCKDCEFRYSCFDCRPDANGASQLSKPWYCTYDPSMGEWKNENDFIDDFLNDLIVSHR